MGLEERILISPKIQKRRALVLGDSLGFPRWDKYQRQPFDRCWPHLLFQRQVEVWQRCQPAAMARNIVEELMRSGPYFGDDQLPFGLLVVQVGIVDCCPRPWPAKFEAFVRRLPMGASIQHWLNQNYSLFLRVRKRPWMSPEKFEFYLREVCERGKKLAEQVVFIEIAPAAHHLARSVTGIHDSIKLYNGILEKISIDCATLFLRPFSVHPSPDELLIHDGVHLSDLGHQVLAEALLKRFD